MRRLIFLVLLVFLLSIAYVRWHGGLAWLSLHRKPTYTPANNAVVNLKDVQLLAEIDAEYETLLQKVVPSVVSIATERRARQVHFGPYIISDGQSRNVLGSGVIVSKEGHIVTNYHVIANMDEIRVQLRDGRVLPAKVIGSDEPVDIAVLQVDAPNLIPLPLGNSDDVQVGQTVFAVGNPFGLQETVTHGIVSATERALPDSGVGFLQSDAAVNPGNSGGPLLNLRGEIVGINSSIFSQTGNSAGVSFAIPSNIVQRSLKSIIETGHPLRGYLGLSTEPLNPAQAQKVGVHSGLRVTGVDHGSPAEKAGIRAGDVIRGVNNREVGTAKLDDMIAAVPIGSKVHLNIVHGDQLGSTTTEVAEMPNNVLAGVEVGAVQNGDGVVVTQVKPDTHAAQQLRIGDIIEYFNNRPVQSPEDFQSAAAALGPGRPAVLLVVRGRQQGLVFIRPEAVNRDPETK
jgi:S1-C subfamily serine protease